MTPEVKKPLRAANRKKMTIVIAGIGVAAVGAMLFLLLSGTGERPAAEAPASKKENAPAGTVRNLTEKKEPRVSGQATTGQNVPQAERKKTAESPSEVTESAFQQRTAPYSEVLNRVADLEARVLQETETANILVESFGARIGQPIPQPQPSEDGRETEIAVDVPGYVAFSPRPESADRMSYTMAKIAELYFARFPKSPRLTISVIRGGGVQGSETYHNSTEATPAQ